MRGGYMELNLASTCDVLVLGSGIAGISAALTAAESGASVILVCKGRLFSGSSFYPVSYTHLTLPTIRLQLLPRDLGPGSGGTRRRSG